MGWFVTSKKSWFKLVSFASRKKGPPYNVQETGLCSKEQGARELCPLLDSVEGALADGGSRGLTLLCLELFLEFGKLTKSDLLFLIQHLLHTLHLICLYY